MSGTQYLKNQLPVLLLNLLGMVVLGLFLLAAGNSLQTVLLIGAVWMTVLAAYLSIVYCVRKKRLNRLLELTEQLEERYLIPEIMAKPERAEEQVYYQVLKLAEKSMLERIGTMERERKAYREYIEQWIHEVKTPITAIKLLCENNRSAASRTLLAELEQINGLRNRPCIMPAAVTRNGTISFVKSSWMMWSTVPSLTIDIYCGKAILRLLWRIWNAASAPMINGCGSF